MSAHIAKGAKHSVVSTSNQYGLSCSHIGGHIGSRGCHLICATSKLPSRAKDGLCFSLSKKKQIKEKKKKRSPPVNENTLNLCSLPLQMHRSCTMSKTALKPFQLAVFHQTWTLPETKAVSHKTFEQSERLTWITNCLSASVRFLGLSFTSGMAHGFGEHWLNGRTRTYRTRCMGKHLKKDFEISESDSESGSLALTIFLFSWKRRRVF